MLHVQMLNPKSLIMIILLYYCIIELFGVLVCKMYYGNMLADSHHFLMKELHLTVWDLKYFRINVYFFKFSEGYCNKNIKKIFSLKV